MWHIQRQFSINGVNKKLCSPKFQISLSILVNKGLGTHAKSVGRLEIITHEKEKLITKTFEVVAHWGSSLIKNDVKTVIKNYVNPKRVNILILENNT